MYFDLQFPALKNYQDKYYIVIYLIFVFFFFIFHRFFVQNASLINVFFLRTIAMRQTQYNNIFCQSNNDNYYNNTGNIMYVPVHYTLNERTLYGRFTTCGSVIR